MPKYVRNHWGIENKLHWILDVQMHEDNHQKAERLSVRSFAMLKRIAANIVRTKDSTPKRSVRRKLRRAAYHNEYLDLKHPKISSLFKESNHSRGSSCQNQSASHKIP